MIEPAPPANRPVGADGVARNSALAPPSTFLITDIEGSARLWEERPVAMGTALAQHDALLRSVVEDAGGHVFKTTGDGLLAVFDEPVAALSAAVNGQRAMRDAAWGEVAEIRVRMAIHSGTAEIRDGDYFGQPVNRSARILAIGHGGQVLVSAMSAFLLSDRLPAGVELRDLGSHRLRDLDRPEQVFQVAVADLRGDFPPLRSLSTRRTNLPLQLTSFVGRDRALADLETLVGQHRLVTLIGTGGTGKTRLMLEAAGRLVDRFPDGTWLAELAPLADPAQVASEIARALGAPEVPGQPALDTVVAFLAEKELLLLLDNAEHLVDAVAAVIGRLLAAAPRLRILTTSREVLAVPGEAVLQLQSLSCPILAPPSADPKRELVDVAAAAETEAVRLFLDRATSVDPGFILGADNVGPVAEICRRLDGIPLAIELAAARVAVMSPDDIATRLGDRFRLLAGGRRTSVPRQQTLHALIDWSWDLLTEDDRRLLRRLSVFAGGWTAGAAARVVGDDGEPVDELEIVDRLARLVDRSLVLVDRGPSTRFRMLETIRQYAREKLIAAGEVEELGDRHLATYASLAMTAAPELRGPGMVDWLDRMDADAENLGAALEWALEADPWAAVRMAASLLAWWNVRVPSEDSDARLVAAIAIARARTIGQPDATPEDQALAAVLLGNAARIWGMGGRAPAALPWARDALELANASGNDEARLAAIGGFTIASIFTGRSDVRELFEEAIALSAATESWSMLATAAAFGGASLAHLDPELGEALVRQGEDAARRSGNPYDVGTVAMAHGRLLGRSGRTDGAIEQFNIAISRFAEVGDSRIGLAVRSDLAHALRHGGRLDEAEAMYRETIVAWSHIGHRGAVANQIESFAFLALDRGQPERAARLLGAAEAIREAAAAPMAFDEEPVMTRAVERLRTMAPADEIEAAWQAGRTLPYADAVTLALET